MPPAFPQDRSQGGPDVSPPQPPPRPLDQQPIQVEKRAPAKSRSIFTPIDESRSLLAQHWGFGTTTNEPVSKNEPPVKQEAPNRSQSVDVGGTSRKNGSKSSAPSRSGQAPGPPHRSSSGSSVSDIPPPSRNGNSMGAHAQNAKRPRLKVQIPSEQSDAGSATADDSPRESAGTTGGAPSAKIGTDGSHSSVVLPPPSPSASALLSAGAQGPPNPFARPHPPGSSAPNNNIETPISALPSRFVADGLLPSPGSFYPEWGFGRAGGDSNMLPSPLNFQTPIAGNGPSFLRDEPEINGKRKSPGSDQSDSAPKRVKA